MAYERYPRSYGRDEGFDRDQDYGRDYGSGRDYTYSSARDYAAAGRLGREDQSGSGRDRAAWRNEDHDRGQRYDWRYDRDDQDRGQHRYGGSYLRDEDHRGSSHGGSYSRNYGGRGAFGGGYDNDRGFDGGSGRHQSPYRGSYASDGRRFAEGRDRNDRDQRYGLDDDDRGFLDRAGDEVRSWFGDEDAERRRERDRLINERDADERQGGSRWGGSGRDEHYQNWRRQRIAELDRDYDEYRQENAQKFHNEFNSFRTERQTQRECLNRVTEHMEVVGSDGEHVGTVDKVRGDRIILTKNDADAGGRHHSIPSRWIDSVDTQVRLRKTADEAKRHWRDEENNQAMFGGQSSQSGQSGQTDRDDRMGRNTDLNRSFSGTY